MVVSAFLVDYMASGGCGSWQNVELGMVTSGVRMMAAVMWACVALLWHVVL